MNGGDEESKETGALSDEYVKDAVLFVVNTHAAIVNMRLYPATSSMVTETLEKALSILETLLETNDSFSVSTIENSLLVNDARLDDLEQSKAPVKAFVTWMAERGLSDLVFRKGVTAEELRKVFELMAEITDSQEMRANFAQTLADEGIDNIDINQRFYVAITAGDEVPEAGAGGGGRKATPLDALKDELLIRYLMGKVELEEVDEGELKEILTDPKKVGGLMSRFLEEEGTEGAGILVKSEKAEAALSRLSSMVEGVEDAGLREQLSEHITGIIAEMSPREMTSVLTGHAPATLDIVHMRANVITMLSDEQLMDIVDSIIDEYEEMKNEAGELDPAWKRDKLKNLNEVLLGVRGGKRGDKLADVIDRRLEEAGIPEELDSATGKRVLSAHDMLDGPLEVEDMPVLGDGVDETVSKQVRQLYAMEENDLAAGMLLKLVGNMDSEQRSIRRYAASLIMDILEAIEPLDPAKKLLAASVLEPALSRTATEERDYQVFVFATDSLAGITELLMKEGRADEASKILELLSSLASPGGDRSIEMVRQASRVLDGLVGPKGMISPAELLSEDDRDKRLRTISALASLGPEALAPLVDLVKDRGRIELRDRALEAIQESGETGIQALVDELKKENAWYIYRNILNVIADLRIVEAVDQVGEMVSHPDERIRREAVRSLARIGSPESLSVVLNATNDSSPAVRRTAVRVLGMFGDSSVGPYLLDLVNGQGPRGKDEDQGVMEAAVLAMGDLHDTDYVSHLSQLLGKGGFFKKGKPDEIRAAACLALGNIGDAKAAPFLEKALKDQSMMVRSSAEKALRRLKGAPATPQPAAPEEVREAEMYEQAGHLVEEVEVGPRPSVEAVEPEVATSGPGEFEAPEVAVPPPHPPGAEIEKAPSEPAPMEAVEPAPEPGGLEPVEGAEEYVLPEEDFLPGRTDQPSTMERMLGDKREWPEETHLQATEPEFELPGEREVPAGEAPEQARAEEYTLVTDTQEVEAGFQYEPEEEAPPVEPTAAAGEPEHDAGADTWDVELIPEEAGSGASSEPEPEPGPVAPADAGGPVEGQAPVTVETEGEAPPQGPAAQSERPVVPEAPREEEPGGPPEPPQPPPPPAPKTPPPPPSMWK